MKWFHMNMIDISSIKYWIWIYLDYSPASPAWRPHTATSQGNSFCRDYQDTFRWTHYVFLVFGFWFLVFGFWFLIFDFWFLKLIIVFSGNFYILLYTIFGFWFLWFLVLVFGFGSNKAHRIKLNGDQIEVS